MLLQNQNFRNAFRPSTLDGFFEFFNKGLDKHLDYKFHNRRLEKHQAELTAAMFEFMHLSLAHVYNNKDDRQSETKTDIQDRPKSLNQKSTSPNQSIAIFRRENKGDFSKLLYFLAQSVNMCFQRVCGQIWLKAPHFLKQCFF